MLFFSLSVLAEYPVELIKLKNRDASELIPVLKPLLSNGGVITGIDKQLIIKSSKGNLDEIRNLIDQLDHPPRSLTIYVRQATTKNRTHYKNQTNINTLVGRNTRLIVGHQGTENSIGYQVKRAQTKGKQDATHKILTLEGRPAFVNTGQLIPVQESSATLSGPILYQQSTTRYKEATTGFYAIPRLNGEIVTIEISTHRIKPGHLQKNFSTQHTQTVISGRLGEWIPVAGASSSSVKKNKNSFYRAETGTDREISIELLVEERL